MLVLKSAYRNFLQGFISAAVTSPVDLVKTRVMNQPVGAHREALVYRNSWDCFRKVRID